MVKIKVDDYRMYFEDRTCLLHLNGVTVKGKEKWGKSPSFIEMKDRR
jgi:hypothetical protein